MGVQVLSHYKRTGLGYKYAASDMLFVLVLTQNKYDKLVITQDQGTASYH